MGNVALMVGNNLGQRRNKPNPPNQVKRPRPHIHLRWFTLTVLATLAVVGYLGIDKLLEIGAFHAITEFALRSFIREVE